MDNGLDEITKLKTEVMESFRKELPVLRARVRASQETVAERVGISRQTYSGIETGKREMSWTIFMALLSFFQYDDQTKMMIKQIDGFENLLSRVMEVSDRD